MSDNHGHEPQDERLERLIRDKQPTGNRLLDDLVGTVPRANPDFQQELEDRLLASLKHTERNAPMIVTDRYPDAKNLRWFSIPLTLAAAMLAVVIAGGVLLTVNRTISNSGAAAQASATMTASATVTATILPTATFIPTRVGNQPAPANPTTLPGILPGIIVPLQGMQAAIYAGPGEDYALIDVLDAGTQVSVLGRTEDSVWLRIQTLSGRDGWITSNQIELPSVPVIDLSVTATPRPASVTTLSPTLVSRQELISLQIPVEGTIVAEASVYASLNNLTLVIAHISPGTAVQITGTTGVFVDNGEERALLQIRLEDGTEGWVDARLVEVLFPPTPVIAAVPVTPTSTAIGWEMTTVVPPADLQPVVIVLRDVPAQTPLTAEDLAVVYWPVNIVPAGTYSDIEALLGASEIVSPQGAIPQWQPILATDLIFGVSDIMPPANVPVVVPLLAPQARMLNLQNGAVVDVYTAMRFVDIDADFQVLATPANLPTPVPGQEAQLVTQRLIDNAQVIQVGAPLETEASATMVTLAVSMQDATVLTWMVEARLPIILLPHDAEPLNVQVGSELMLLGYTTDHQQSSLRFTLYWYAHEHPGADYSLSVHVENEAREIVFQHDSALLDSEGNASSQWAQGAIVASESTLDFAESQGEYMVRVGLSRVSDGVRLPIISPAASGETRIEDDNSLLLYRFTQE